MNFSEISCLGRQISSISVGRARDVSYKKKPYSIIYPTRVLEEIDLPGIDQTRILVKLLSSR